MDIMLARILSGTTRRFVTNFFPSSWSSLDSIQETQWERLSWLGREGTLKTHFISSEILLANTLQNCCAIKRWCVSFLTVTNPLQPYRILKRTPKGRSTQHVYPQVLVHIENAGRNAPSRPKLSATFPRRSNLNSLLDMNETRRTTRPYTGPNPQAPTRTIWAEDWRGRGAS
jgi:hypothetical protein